MLVPISWLLAWRINDWNRHMGRLIEKREASAERMRRFRARSASTADSAQGDPSSDTRDGGDDGGTRVTRTLRDKSSV